MTAEFKRKAVTTSFSYFSNDCISVARYIIPVITTSGTPEMQ